MEEWKINITEHYMQQNLKYININAEMLEWDTDTVTCIDVDEDGEKEETNARNETKQKGKKEKKKYMYYMQCAKQTHGPFEARSTKHEARRLQH